MALPNGRESKPVNNKDRKRHPEDVSGRLGVTERESCSTGHESNSVFYSNSEGADKTGSWASSGGQTTSGGIRRRLNELHETCLRLIESQQQQLEFSLQESKRLAEEMQNLQSLLGEVSEPFFDNE